MTQQSDTPAIEDAVDAIVLKAITTPLPPVVYHYSSLEAVESILKTQMLWLTWYSHMNDPEELVSADSAIKQALEAAATEAEAYDVSNALNNLRAQYPALSVSQLIPVFMICFSSLRDDHGQWCRYGAHGAGACLGVKVMDETKRPIEGLGMYATTVGYDRASWEARLHDTFGELSTLFGGPGLQEEDKVQILSGFARAAAATALATKKSKWASEHEVRVLALYKDEMPVPGLKQRARNGSAVDYVELPARDDGKLIALSEIIVGPDAPLDAPGRINAVLEAVGYTRLDDCPTVVESQAPTCR